MQTVRIWLRGALVRGALRARAARGADGERRAEGLLRARGFEVLERQARARWAVRVDGEGVPVDLRADLIVARGGRTFVAEVKTGALAPRIGTPATRRQLLEYRVAFAVDGVLLVDADVGAVREVQFALPGGETSGARDGAGSLGWLVLGLALGAGGALWLTRPARAEHPVGWTRVGARGQEK